MEGGDNDSCRMKKEDKQREKRRGGFYGLILKKERKGIEKTKFLSFGEYIWKFERQCWGDCPILDKGVRISYNNAMQYQAAFQGNRSEYPDSAALGRPDCCKYHQNPETDVI